MRTGSLAGRSSQLLNAQVALRRFLNWEVGIMIEDKIIVVVTNIDHPYIVIWAIVGTGCTADARRIVDDHLALNGVPMDSPSGAPDHTDRIHTMHTGIGDHILAQPLSMSQKSRIILVSCCTSADTVVTTSTTFKID